MSDSTSQTKYKAQDRYRNLLTQGRRILLVQQPHLRTERRNVSGTTFHYISITVSKTALTCHLRCSKLRNKKRIRLRIPRRKRTLRNTVHSIVSSRMKLPDTMPMNAGPIILHRIFHRNTQRVAPRCPDERAGILVVDQKTESVAITVWVACPIGDLEVVGDDLAGFGEFFVEVRCDAVAIFPAGAGFGAVGTLGVLCFY